jgi:hypothetical protein
MKPPALAKIAKDADHVYQSVSAYEGVLLADAELSKLVKEVAIALARQNRIKPEQLKPEHLNAVYAALAQLRNKEVARKQLKANITRLAANWHYIAEGRPIPMWDGSPLPCALLCQGLTRKPPLPDGRMMFAVRLKAQDSIIAGITIDTEMQDHTLELFAVHRSGTFRMKPGPEDVSGMQFMAMLELRGSDVKVTDMYCKEVQKQHNKELMKARLDNGKCNTPALQCYQCAKNILQCPLAIWLPKEGND